jgi:cytochrome c oxidase subunit 3
MGDFVEYDTKNGKPHPYHLVRPSAWPLISSFAAGLLALGLVWFMHGVEFDGLNIGLKGVIAGFIAVLICMFFWWKDGIYEATFEKAHSAIAMIGMRYGMILFIASEVMFFVAFFWAFFANAFFPVGGIWPPEGITVIPALDLPLLMTMILLLSGCTVTWAHHAFLENNIKEAATGLGLSVALGVLFLGFQAYEYMHAPFGFTDGIYASTFYLATGFHGFHVLVGTIFLGVCWFRTVKGHFDSENHFGFEAAAWYWHFVDVVWLFLFIAVYWWGAGNAPVMAH